MDKSIIVEVKVIDNDTGNTLDSTVKIYQGRCGYGYEVEGVFEQLGIRFGKVIDS